MDDLKVVLNIEVNIKGVSAMNTATEPASARCFPPGDVKHEVPKTFGGLLTEIQPSSEVLAIWQSAIIAKCPKVSEMTEEQLEVFASAVYDNMMAKVASDDSPPEAGESACSA